MKVVVDNNIIINSMCACKKQFNSDTEKLVILFPCYHLIHQQCIKFKFCPICFKKYKYILTEDIIAAKHTKNKFWYQLWIDINSMKIPSISYHSNIMYFKRSPYIISHFFNIDSMDFHTWVGKLLKILNIKVEIENNNLVDTKEKKIYVMNHTHFIDPLSIFMATKCAFLSGQFIKKTGLLRYAKVPVLIIDRGVKNNTTQQIKDFLDNPENPSLCIFPEGMMTNSRAITRFRTGAFYCDYPIQPVVVEYTNCPSNVSFTKMMSSLLSQDQKYPITAKLKFLETIRPPFKDVPKLTEDVRNQIAKAGKLYISRVSNKDLKEEDTKSTDNKVNIFDTLKFSNKENNKTPHFVI